MLTAKEFKQYISGEKRGLGAMLMRGLMRATECVYTWGVNYRNRQYDSGTKEIISVSVPVISVGNITLGGTGKTPMVAYLSRWLQQQGVHVTLISRGYGAEQGKQNDEALELEQLLPNVPHLQNPDRVAAAQQAIQEYDTQCLVLDDAFQHRRIGRDLDMVLIDATEPFGFDHVFPRGSLREPLTGLARADLLVLTRGDMVRAETRTEIKQRLAQYNETALVIELNHQPAMLRSASGEQRSLEDCRGKKVAVFCAIGNPAGFRHTIESCGMEIVAFQEFDDHYRFVEADKGIIVKWLDQLASIDAVLCTHKDLVKLNQDTLGRYPLFALTIEAQISDEDQQQLESLLLPLVEIIT